MENQKSSNFFGGVTMTKIIDLKIKEKIYKNKKLQISILNNFNLEVNAGEKIAIVGESGVGKSSLLNIIGLLDRDYNGEYTLFDSRANSLHTSELAQWRNQKIGFVLQESALINSLTIEDNIKLPLLYADSRKKEFKQEDFENVINAIDIKSIKLGIPLLSTKEIMTDKIIPKIAPVIVKINCKIYFDNTISFLVRGNVNMYLFAFAISS